MAATSTTTALPALPGPSGSGTRIGPLSGLTGHERVAAFLIAVGEEAATAILKNMPEDDVERIALEIHKQAPIGNSLFTK